MEQMWILMVFQNGADIQTAMDRLEKRMIAKCRAGILGRLHRNYTTEMKHIDIVGVLSRDLPSNP